MRKSVLGGLTAVLLITTTVLALYIYASGTSSTYRLEQFGSTVSFMDDRIDAMEKNRALLQESSASLERELATLNKRIEQIDAEIVNMSDLIGNTTKSIKSPLFTWNSFRMTTGSSLLVIAFLACIWLLYSVTKKKDSPLDEIHREAPGKGELEPGSVLEEEFPLEREPTTESEKEVPAEPAAEAPPEEDRQVESPFAEQSKPLPEASEQEEKQEPADAGPEAFDRKESA